MATYYYGRDAKDSKWYFRLRDNNNEIILASTEGYNAKQGCLNGIDSVKHHASSDHYYKTFTGKDGKYYFTLHAANGEPIGRSEGYNTARNRDAGKENVEKEAPAAGIKELSENF